MFKIHYKSAVDKCNKSIITIEESIKILNNSIDKTNQKDTKEIVINNLTNLITTIKDSVKECEKIYDQCKTENYCGEKQLKTTKNCIKKSDELIKHIEDLNNSCLADSKCTEKIKKFLDIAPGVISAIDEFIESMHECKDVCINR